MKIAAHPILANAKHVSYLPPSWGTLYELTKLDHDMLIAALMLETMGEFPKRPMGRIGLRLGARHVPAFPGLAMRTPRPG